MSITKINIFKNFAKIPLSFAVQNPVSAVRFGRRLYPSTADAVPLPLGKGGIAIGNHRPFRQGM